MADVTVGTQTVDEPTATTTATTGDATGTNGGQEPAKTFTQADVDRIIAERVDRAQRKAEETAAKAREAEQRKAAEEQGKFQELYEQMRTKAETAETEARQIRLASLRERIARSVGLPDSLASRLVGEDEDSIMADAKALAKAFPRPSAPNINAQPGNGAAPQPGQMTDAERQELAAVYGVNPRFIT